jgi:glucokinase
MKKYALGIDIGGTNIAIGLVDRFGKVIFEESTPTNQYNKPADFINYLKSNTIISENQNEIQGIGVGAPNGNHFKGTIDYAPNLSWKGIIPLKQLLEDAFGMNTQLTNDANAAAIGEKMFGCAQDLSNFVTITLGTGLGSGIISNNQIMYGQNGYAGEFGHIRVIPKGRLCNCGREGCLETYASSTGVVRSVKELESAFKSTSKITEIKNIDAKKIFELAEEGDKFANEIVDFTAKTLGSALADFAAFSDPQAYILFGGIAQSGIHFANQVKKYMEDNLLLIFKNKIEIRISSLHNQNAAILGNAASVFLENN